MKKTILLLIFAAALIVAIYVINSYRNPSGTSALAKTDFPIADTSSIGKIFIADGFGNTITLSRRENNQWDLNGKYRAREDAVSTLLRTFKNVYIQRTVPKNAQDQVNSVMAGSSKKVEIYTRQGDWIKTWYVGHATMDKKGTYMLLETPKYGKASEPYILDMRGFIGMLNTRFFTNENEWRSTSVIKYPELSLDEVVVSYPGSDEQSFGIAYTGGNNIQLFTMPQRSPIKDFDSTLVKDYLLNFKLASFSNYRTGLEAYQIDSVKSLPPYQIITIKDKTGLKEIKLWPKGDRTGQKDSLGGMILDNERIYASLNNGELALAQRFAWDKFRAPLQVFMPPKKVDTLNTK